MSKGQNFTELIRAAMDSSRDEDINGYITIEDNPISRSGVFPYSGANLPDADPNKIYQVYRPESELDNPDTLKSFQLLPLINEHVMMGEGYETAVEDKGMHGFTGEKVFFKDGILYSTLRVVSDTLKGLLSNGKKQLSAGYRCIFEKSSGVFNGVAYDYIQRNIRGNHIALVREGRSGPDIAVLDWAFDHFDLAIDEGEKDMSKEIQAALDAALADNETLKKKVAAMDAAEEEKKKKEAEDEDLEKDGKGMDADEEEAKKKKDAEDKAAKDSDDEDKEKDKKAMDAMDSRVAALEKRDTKAILRDISARDAIVKQVAPLIGVFDHAESTKDEVIAYALDQLEIKAPKGQEEAALNGFLAGRRAALEKSGGHAVGFALDTGAKPGGLLDKTLKGAKA